MAIDATTSAPVQPVTAITRAAAITASEPARSPSTSRYAPRRLRLSRWAWRSSNSETPLAASPDGRHDEHQPGPHDVRLRQPLPRLEQHERGDRHQQHRVARRPRTPRAARTRTSARRWPAARPPRPRPARARGPPRPSARGRRRRAAPASSPRPRPRPRATNTPTVIARTIASRPRCAAAAVSWVWGIGLPTSCRRPRGPAPRGRAGAPRRWARAWSARSSADLRLPGDRRADLVERRARVERVEAHLARLVEVPDPEVRDDHRRPAALPAAARAGSRSACSAPPRLPGEVRKSIRSTNERADWRMITNTFAGVDRDLARAARARQPRRRRVVVADDRRVDVAEPVDLRRAQEPDVDQAALQVEREQLEHRRPRRSRR